MAIKIVNPQVVSFSPVSTAEVGQTIKVKTVDENNKPIEWEATDFPEGGGASSWNDLKDKPFGDESVTIEWNGDTEGKVSYDLGGMMLVKVSDLTPEPADLVGCILEGSFNGTTTSGTIPQSMIGDGRESGNPVCYINYYTGSTYAPIVMVIYGQYLEISETGIYFMKMGTNHPTKLSYGSIKKLDPKYLPEGGVGYDVETITDTLNWDGVVKETDVTVVDALIGSVCKVSDHVPTMEDLSSGCRIRVSDNGNDRYILITADNINTRDENVISILTNGVVIISKVGATISGGEFPCEFPEEGIYFNYGITGTVTALQINGYNFGTELIPHKIDPKYLPEGIGYEETYTGEITIEWDGDPTGKPTVDAGEGMLIVKISDNTPSMSEVLSGQVVIDGESMSITEDMLIDAREEGVPVIIVAEGIFI